jgi:fatty-acyl-CoA synthase
VTCAGGVLHTINPRLFPAQISYIIRHAADRYLLADPAFVPLLEGLQHELSDLQRIVILCDPAQMPATELRNVLCYEALLAAESDQFDWPELDEQAASAMCYTSGTTGNPKGVLYSHRSTVLHAMAAALPDSLNLSACEVVMPMVPMFHVNAWGTPYAAPMTGAKLVLAGPAGSHPATIRALIEETDVTVALGVPTVWLGLLELLQREGGSLGSLRRIVVGGAACTAAIVEGFARYGVRVETGWGMTEMSPLGTYNAPIPGMECLPAEEKLRAQLMAGRALFGVEMKITDDENRELPWDGKTAGALKVRGPWVCAGYYRPEENAHTHDADGWLHTGDVATIDPQGFMQVTDRTKDLIKSGGEWISSLELENVAMTHPAVAEAAVIGVAHPQWLERPLLVAVLRPGAQASARELLAWFDGKVAKWWIPDDVAFVAELPHTATGKLSKARLREQFRSRQ